MLTLCDVIEVKEVFDKTDDDLEVATQTPHACFCPRVATHASPPTGTSASPAGHVTSSSAVPRNGADVTRGNSRSSHARLFDVGLSCLRMRTKMNGDDEPDDHRRTGD